MLGITTASTWQAAPYTLFREKRAAQRTRFFTGNNAVDAGAAGAALGVAAQYFANLLQSVNASLFSPALKINVDGGPHASAEVGGAGVDVAVLLVKAEVLARLLLDRLLDGLDTLGEPGEDLLNISSLLHGDDTELILLVDPDEEGLVPVVEDTTSLGPVTLHTGN